MADTTPDTAAPAPSRLGEKLPADLVLTPVVDGVAGTGRPIMEWLTTFHLASVVLDPYTNESSWVLKSATRVLEQFRGSDARINLVVTANAADASAFLGPYAERFLVFSDPDRSVVKAMGLSELPAFVFTRVDGVVAAAAQGWNPPEWEAVADAIAEVCWWTSIPVPGPGDPGPFRRFARIGLTPVPSGPDELPDLPVVEAIPELRTSLADRRRAVLVAPPGAGKTTVIPLALLDETWLGAQRIVMLEPRRLATRAAARRMAGTTRTDVGALIGYQTRDERHIGSATRIEVVTEGVLTRRLQNDPELPGVGLVIFDEVHERNLTTDLGLALACSMSRRRSGRTSESSRCLRHRMSRG